MPLKTWETKLRKKGYNVTVAGAGVTNEKDETGKYTSGGVFIVVKSNVACVIDKKRRS